MNDGMDSPKQSEIKFGGHRVEIYRYYLISRFHLKYLRYICTCFAQVSLILI